MKRRTLTTGAAWAIPAVAMTAAAPAMAVSPAKIRLRTGGAIYGAQIVFRDENVNNQPTRGTCRYTVTPKLWIPSREDSGKYDPEAWFGLNDGSGDIAGVTITKVTLRTGVELSGAAGTEHKQVTYALEGASQWTTPTYVGKETHEGIEFHMYEMSVDNPTTITDGGKLIVNSRLVAAGTPTLQYYRNPESNGSCASRFPDAHMVGTMTIDYTLPGSSEVHSLSRTAKVILSKG